MQLKEALDFGVACCPELKLAGCSQEIYISLQVVQNKIKEKKKCWFGFVGKYAAIDIAGFRYTASWARHIVKK